ncbi:Ribonuclease H [Leptomonas seymouri]|uniref:ribonuclease H n=1 Tax=Leptomonas seymouri TaxID=5684 RepID=A0A0N1PC83_LEPSE|nr:Ribonuclease H [Leptomonas seymouri]|eukprot:KPI87625.1 Ribonuclease H [Leptomonas seymouri]
MKPSFYAVALGRQRGIYSTWDQCSEQVSGYSGATYKSFRTLAEARAFLDEHPVRHTPQNCDVGDAPVAGTALSLPRVKPVRCRDDGVEAAEAPAAASLSPAKRARAGAEEVFGAREGQRPLSSSHPQAVYVDGACSRNGTPNARAGYGGYFGSSDDARNFALPVPITEAQTNNRGELRAVIHGIVQGFVDAGIPKEALATSHCVTPDWRASELARPLQRLVIHTDSRYVIDGLTRYSSKWVENGFKLTSKEPVLNQDLWKQLIRLRDAYNTCYAQQQHEMRSRHPYESMAKSSVSPPKRFHTHNTHNDETEGIELRYVKGHSNNHGNEMADMLAVRGSRMHGETCMK